MFLFYSGFGINESFKKRGIDYIKTLPIKAFILFLKFQIILLIFLIVNIFVLNNRITLKLYFFSIIFRASLGNSNWFAFTIIVFYIYSFISFLFVKKNLYGIIILSFICFFHSIFVYNYYYTKKISTVDNILCFIIGFYYSLFKIYINRIVMKNDISYFGCISIIIIIYYKVLMINRIIFISIRNALFALLIVLISMKVKFNNNFLIFLNSHSFSIYLFQRLVFLIVYEIKIFKEDRKSVV